jgi:hypothetical protein
VSETHASIGQQLDDLGLTVELERGHRVLEATVTLVTGDDEFGAEQHRPINLPRQKPGATPVPHPVERRIVTVVAEGQEVSEEQRKRVTDWLEANGVDPRRVARRPITIESNLRGDMASRVVIGFWEYYENAAGQRVINERTLEGALLCERWVEQKVPLAPDPTWKGWDAARAQHAAEGSE